MIPNCVRSHAPTRRANSYSVTAFARDFRIGGIRTRIADAKLADLSAIYLNVRAIGSSCSRAQLSARLHPTAVSLTRRNFCETSFFGIFM